VGYAPTPIGVDATVTPPYGDYFTSKYAEFWARDLPIIKAVGANAVRLWGWDITADHKAFLDAVQAADLFVIPTFYMAPGTYPNLADPATKSKVYGDFDQFLKAINHHPAVLFYILGSDLNADWNYGFEKDVLFEVLNGLAVRAKTLEATNPRPVTTGLNDQLSVQTIKAFDTATKLDFWSVNVYRGCDFGTLFKEFTASSSRPLFISEFGIDAWDDVASAVNEEAQAQCYAKLWSEIQGNNSVAIGGSNTQYVDEWWKSKLAQADARHPSCPNYNATKHANCGYPNDNFPDKYANQAWFGIVDAEFKLRRAYNQLQELWSVEK